MEDQDENLGVLALFSGILLTPMVGNAVLHDISLVLHLLQMKGLFCRQAHEDANKNLKNFVEVCQ